MNAERREIKVGQFSSDGTIELETKTITLKTETFSSLKSAKKKKQIQLIANVAGSYASAAVALGGGIAGVTEITSFEDFLRRAVGALLIVLSGVGIKTMFNFLNEMQKAEEQIEKLSQPVSVYRRLGVG